MIKKFGTFRNKKTTYFNLLIYICVLLYYMFNYILLNINSRNRETISYTVKV